jgi:hypothetical protein
MLAEAMNWPAGSGPEPAPAPGSTNGQRGNGAYPAQAGFAQADSTRGGNGMRRREDAGAAKAATPVAQPSGDTLRSIRERLQQR